MDVMKNKEPGGKRIRILRLALSVNETNAAYNQFSLPMFEKQDITMCTFFRSNVTTPDGITLVEGDDSVAGFFRALNAALAQNTFDVIHAHTPHVGFLLLASATMRRRIAAPTVYTMHTSFSNYNLRNALLCLPIFAFFRRIVCCSRASLTSLPHFYRWLAGPRLRAVPNGVDIDRIDRTIGNGHRRIADGSFTIATVGRLIDAKNPLSVLSAFQKSNSAAASLIFIGEGELKGALLRARKAYDIEEQVRLTGLLPREKVYGYLAAADLFISASRTEGLPIAPLEAMACGCPVILSDIPAHREIAEGMDFIPLINPDDVAGFAWQIRRFQRMAATERMRISSAVRELVQQRFSLTSMHERYAAVYTEARQQP